MSAAPPLKRPGPPALRVPGVAFAAGFVALVVASAVFAGAVPVAFSIATVFLFAGPHNWLEARYVLGRLPARFGKLRGFFLLSAAGMLGLTAGFAALPWLFAQLPDAATQGAVLAGWNTASCCGWRPWCGCGRGRTRGSTAGGCGRRHCSSRPACGSTRSP